MDGLIQKNNINDYRLEHTGADKTGIKKFDYGEFVNGMTETDLKSDDFLAYKSTHIRQVRGRLKLNIPLYVSSRTDANCNKQMVVRWQMCTRDKYLNEITVSEGMLTADYMPNSITYIGDIKLITPMVDAVGILKMWLMDSETEQTVMRNFVLFDIRQRKGNIYYPDFTDIIANGFDDAKIICDGNVYYADGRGTLCSSMNKHDIPGFEYGSPLEILFEAVPVQNNATVKLYVNNILLEKRLIKKPPERSRGVLTKLYHTDSGLDKITCGYVFRAEVPSFVCKGLPDYFSVRIETDGGIILFGRKSGRYPVGLEVKINEKYG